MSYEVYVQAPGECPRDCEYGCLDCPPIDGLGNMTINVSHVWYWLMPGGGLRQLDGMHPEDAAEAVRWGLGRWEHLSEDERFPYYELEPKNGWGSVAGAIEYMQRIERGCARYPREHYPNHKVRVER